MSSIPRSHNVCLDVAEYLSAQWGFEHVSSRATPGIFRLLLDDQHSSNVQLSGWRERPPEGGTGTGFIFGVGRRDINELWLEVIDARLNDPRRATVQEGPPFFGRSRLSLSSGSDRDEMRAWCDVWVERLVAEPGSLSWVVSYMETDPEPLDNLSPEVNEDRVRKHRNSMLIPRMLNRMLDGGWSDADDELFLSPMRADIERLEADHMWHQTQSRRLAAIQEWIDEHPDGVEREFTD